MIGIVIWSCAQSQRVILWCDDNGPLAFARGATAFVGTGPAFPAVGDLVAFEARTEDPQRAGRASGETPRVRHASAVRVVERAHLPQVDRLLRETAAAGALAAQMPAPARPHLRLAATG